MSGCNWPRLRAWMRLGNRKSSDFLQLGIAARARLATKEGDRLLVVERLLVEKALVKGGAGALGNLVSRLLLRRRRHVRRGHSFGAGVRLSSALALL